MEKEKASFDEFDKWCTETIAEAKKDITDGEELLASTKERINEIAGAGAASGEEVKNAEQNLVKNSERLEESARMHEQEAAKNKAALDEIIASITAMDKALAELSGAQASNPTFLQKGAAVMSIQKLLKIDIVKNGMSYHSRQVLSAFAAKQGKSNSQAFMQLQADSNTDEIIKVIESVKSDFEKKKTDLDTDMADAVKAYTDLKGTLTKEKASLESFLTEQKALTAAKGKELSDKKILRDETEVQLKADKKLLTTTQDNCKEKTYRYNDRKKDRDMELAGVNKALGILSSEEAQATFGNAAKVSLVQVQNSVEASSKRRDTRQQAYDLLQALASKTHNLKLARMAVEVKTAREGAPDDPTWGVFSKVVKSIDGRIESLHEEGQRDVEHRDRCKRATADNSASLATLDDQIGKTSAKIERMESEVNQQEDTLAKIKEDINATEKDMTDLEAQRKEEREAAAKALKDDKDALVLLKTAVETVSKFFRKKGVDVGQDEIPMVDLSRKKATAEPGELPQGEYKGAQDTTGSLLKMMSIVRDNFEAEIEHDIADEEKNEEAFGKDYGALKDLLKTQKAKEVSASKALADLQEELQAKHEYKDTKSDEKAAEEEAKHTLEGDCGWVKTNFESRREKRKTEIDSLVQAKGILQGLPEP
eukprot:TRINITY_DN95548_c0_g1_i1.p1 TRINITY_DN95548_c0_g1~~TRINITY_DN95548_c0_g1_i1.p1  ORF type:complete len:718 (+),score=254.72 TRINITY_DN95548_c0_g1_i1:201-2156(+)